MIIDSYKNRIPDKKRKRKIIAMLYHRQESGIEIRTLNIVTVTRSRKYNLLDRDEMKKSLKLQLQPDCPRDRSLPCNVPK